MIISKEFLIQANNFCVGWILWLGLFVIGFFYGYVLSPSLFLFKKYINFLLII